MGMVLVVLELLHRSKIVCDLWHNSVVVRTLEQGSPVASILLVLTLFHSLAALTLAARKL